MGLEEGKNLDDISKRNTSIDFEIALTALIATAVTTVPSYLEGFYYTIPVLFSVSLLVLTLVRKMLMMSGEEDRRYFKGTMLLINIFSLISVIYVYYNISKLPSSISKFFLSPISVTIGLVVLITLEAVMFHLLITKDFLDYVYFGTLFRKKESEDSKLGNYLGSRLQLIMEGKIAEEVPKEYVSDKLSNKLELKEKYSSFAPFWKASSSVLTVSLSIALIVQFISFFDILDFVLYLLSIISVIMILVPIQLWYWNYGQARFEDIYEGKIYGIIVILGFIHFFVIYQI